MITTSKQDKDFIASIINSALLDTAIEWISDNLNPDDVFSERDLTTWAKENGFLSAVIYIPDRED